MSAPSPIPSPSAAPSARACGGIFVLLCVVHLVVWTALPTLLYRNLPLDLIEALTYGREWQLGYDKLPPLPWWLVEAAYRLVGHDAAYYALAQIAVIGAFAAVFATARPLVGAAGALVAVLIADGLHYFSYTAAKFNHDVVQLPFWALAGLAFHRALRHGSPLSWILLGASLGAAAWAKYFVVVLAAPLGLFLLLDPQARRSWTTPGPYLALAAALVVVAPHLLWLVRNDFLPFAYADGRAVAARGLFDHLWHPVQFAAGQLFFLLPSLLVALPLVAARWSGGAGKAMADRYDQRIVAVLALGPAATVLVLSAVTGRGTIAMWGYPLWLFLGLWIVLAARAAVEQQLLRRTVALWAAVTAVLAAAFVVNYAVLPRMRDRYQAVLYPGEQLAQQLSQRFRAATGRPPAYVIADMWDGGNVGHYAPERPRVLIDGKPARAPWIDLADVARQGAIVLWTNGDPARMPEGLRAAAPGAEVQAPFEVPFRLGRRSLPVGWAILRPAGR